MEDDPVYRGGLRVILEPMRNHVEIVAEAGDAEQAIVECRRHRPDLVLLDMRLPLRPGLYSRALVEHGLESIRMIRQESPGSKVLVLSHHDTQIDLFKAIQAGAYGYLSKGDVQDSDSLIEAMESVMQGQAVFGRAMAELIHRFIGMDDTPAAAPGELEALGRRAVGENSPVNAESIIEKVRGGREDVTARLTALLSERLRTPVPVDLFYSYSHRDEDLREKLVTHLAMLKNQGVIRDWHDRQIGAGTEWAGQIDEHLNRAGVILLLISSSFLASRYCYDIEMRRAMERHHAGEARVIPVILRSCDWKGAPFEKLQALPKDAKPVMKWSDRDEAFTDVARGIRRAVEELRRRR